jgi:nitrogen regulatory protein PII
MKLIVAIIRPEKLDAVQAAVNGLETGMMSVSQVVGDAREPGYTEIYRGREVKVPRPKLRIEIVVSDLLAQRVVQAIARTGSSGHEAALGDGSIFVMHLDNCIAISGNPSTMVPIAH